NTFVLHFGPGGRTSCRREARYDTLPRSARFILGSEWSWQRCRRSGERSLVMKLTFLPTLTDMREMLGDRLYVEFVWAWREQEQEKRQKDNRARWADQLPERTASTWPQPLVVREIAYEELPEPMPAQV